MLCHKTQISVIISCLVKEWAAIGSLHSVIFYCKVAARFSREKYEMMQPKLLLVSSRVNLLILILQPNVTVCTFSTLLMYLALLIKSIATVRLALVR